MSNSQAAETVAPRTLRSSTARNPRRRQRQSDGDSLKTTAPRRKRSKITENTFTPRDCDDADGNALPAMNGMANGHSHKRESTPATTTDMDLPVRGRKGTIKRAMKGDGAKALTQNNTYSVKLLPSTPRDLTRHGVEYRGSLGAGHHALAITRGKAYIWDYTAHTSVSHAREFMIPFRTRSDEPIPFGALVTSAASTDIGLLLVSATTGKVVFYESIERAASIGLFQERQTGIEGSLGSLHSGEAVVDLMPSEHVGFIVLLSSSRIFQLTLRDAQGKARIFSQHLKATPATSNGLFGSIKGFLGSMLHKGIMAVHTRALDTRGQMQVIALSEKAQMQIWDLDWSGNHDFRANIDFRDLLVRELKTLQSPEMQGLAESAVALDFALVDRPPPRRNEVATLAAELPLDVWILLRVGDANSGKFVLAELSLAGEDVSVKRLQELETYFGKSNSRPKFVLPKPGHTGYVVFEDAIVLFATADVQLDGPEAQLHASYQDLRPFEDTVYLRSDRNLLISGATAEESKTGQASCIAFVENAGLVRLSAIDPAGDIERTRISAKDRIAQAVYYGGKEDNLLDFARRGDLAYPMEEVEAAVVSISDDIVRSDTAAFAKSPVSMEDHLSARGRALRGLINHVKQHYPGLSARTMWQLLWDAEKIAAGTALWQLFEEHKAAVGKTKRSATVLDELCARAQQRYQWAAFDGASGDELVQRMFVSGLDHLGELLPLIRPLLEELESDGSAEAPEKVVRIANEANDIWIRAMYAVFDFRMDHGYAYGIAPELLVDGVLTDLASYVDLPEFWSSTDSMLKALIKTARLSRDFAVTCFNIAPGMEDRISKISSDNPRLIEAICRMYKERIPWQASRPSQRDRDIATKLKQHFDDVRYDEIRELMSLGQSDAAMSLAEKYRDMSTLTELVVMDSQYFLEHQQTVQHPDEQKVVTKHLDDLLKRTGRYFDKFGDDWANAFFDAAFSGSRAGLMLDEAQQNWEEALTRYLRADSSRARVCWINDVMARRDYRHAARELIVAGRDQETKLWAKKVEMSLSKLALLAAREEESQRPDANREEKSAEEGRNPPTEELSLPTRELTIVDAQEQLYRHVYHEIKSCIDREAEVQVTMTKFVERQPELLPNLKHLLEVGLERLLDHHVLTLGDLIDVLTLINNITYPDADDVEGNLQGSEFYLAFVALNAAAPDLNPKQFETLLKLVWKRCYLSDDWVAINSTAGGKGATERDLAELIRQTAAWRTLYQLHASAPLAYISILKPIECFGAGCREEDLADRFPEELLRPIVQDNQVQDEMLQHYVTDRRLEEWIDRCDGDAKRTVDAEAELQAQLLADDRRAQEESLVDGSDAPATNGFLIDHEAIDEDMVTG